MATDTNIPSDAHGRDSFSNADDFFQARETDSVFDAVQVAQAAAPTTGAAPAAGTPQPVEIPAGATVVRVPVTPGEVLELGAPFTGDAALIGRVGDGNLAIKVGDVTVILQGYVNANGQAPVTVETSDGKHIDVATMLASTDPALDIQTAAGPNAAGPQGAENSGAIFAQFGPGGGLGGFSAVGALDGTSLNYGLIDNSIRQELAAAPSLGSPFSFSSSGPLGPLNEGFLRDPVNSTPWSSYQDFATHYFAEGQGNWADFFGTLSEAPDYLESLHQQADVTTSTSPATVLLTGIANIGDLTSDGSHLQVRMADGNETAFIYRDADSALVAVVHVTVDPTDATTFHIDTYLINRLDDIDANGNPTDSTSLDVNFNVYSGEVTTNPEQEEQQLPAGGLPGTASFQVADDAPLMDPHNPAPDTVTEGEKADTVTGTFNFNFGADGPLDAPLVGGGSNDVVSLLSSVTSAVELGLKITAPDDGNTTYLQFENGALVLSNLTSGTKSVDVAESHDNLGHTILTGSTDGGATTIFTITVTDATGAWTFQLDGALDHPGKGEVGSADQFQFDLTATITDDDLDAASGSETFFVNDGGVTVVPPPPPQGDDQDPASYGAGTLVYESALATGSDPSATTETTTGTVTITAPDGVSAITVAGVSVDLNTVANTPVIHGAYGDLTITSWNPATGTLDFSYTLLKNDPDHSAATGNDIVQGEDFSLVATDGDGDATTADIKISIVDDVPIAHADELNVAPADFASHSGNVVTALNEVSASDADALGADNAKVVGVAAGDLHAGQSANVGTEISGAYGKLTLNDDGGYTYTRDAGTPGGVDDVFTYTLKDGDGDTSTTTLTIHIGDSPVTIDIPPFGDASDTVDEKGLAARPGEPAGSGEIADGDGTNNSDTSEKAGGVITIHAPDGVQSIQIPGHTLSATDLANLSTSHVTFTDGFGSIFTLTNYDASTGQLSYTYELTDNVLASSATSSIELIVTDLDGDSKTSFVQFSIIDDAPTANPDELSVAPADFAVHSGNVITALNEVSASGADVLGADNAKVVGVASGDLHADQSANVGVQIDGSYGKLTLNDDGSYTYTRDHGTKGGVDDVFTYTLKDGDGDTSTTTLTIHIGDSPVTIDTPPLGDASDTVYEQGLAARPGEPAGSGEIADGNGTNNSDPSETTSGVITITAPDGVQSVQFTGHAAINAADLANLSTTNVVYTDATGTLTLTGFDAATGKLSYTYELLDNTLSDPSSVSFDLTVTDTDGDTKAGTLVIGIIDDAPTANADELNVTAADFTAHSGNVITALNEVSASGVDVLGADNAKVVGVAAGDLHADQSSNVGSQIDGSYGKLTLNDDGSYTYTRDAGTKGGVDDVFTYTLKDSDGDTSTTTLTIHIGNSPVTIDTPLLGDASDTVYEKGLAERPGEPAGSGEIADGNPTNNSDPSEKTSGFITITAPDGVQSVQFTGHAALDATALANLSTTNVAYTDATGTLTLTGFDATTGKLSYTYELLDNTLTDPSSVSFGLTATDTDGDTKAGTLVIGIIDDAPTANADELNVAPADFLAHTGNVITALNEVSASDADVLGADNAKVVGVASGDLHADQTENVGTEISGSYGKLTLNDDGSYTYTRNAGSAGGVDDVFTYTLKDGDGDTSTTTLTIHIGDSPVTVTTPPLGDASDTVYEKGLAARPGEPAGSGEIADGNGTNNSDPSEKTSGVITINAPDGVQSVQFTGHTALNATDLANLSTTNVSYTDATGTLTLTGFDAATGKLSYTYELLDNTLTDPSSVNFGLTVTDKDGDTKSGTLAIGIIDDAPTANADELNVASADFTAHSGNVITALNEVSASGADVLGADNAKVVGVAAGDLHADQGANVGVQISGTYGKLTLGDDGSYTYTRNTGTKGGVDDVFTYTLKDGDGDTSTTTLTIHIGNSPVTITTPPLGDASDTVYEKGLAVRPGEPAGSGEIADGNGTNNSDPSEKTSGIITISAPDGLQSVQFTGHAALSATDLANLSTTNVIYADATGTLTLTGFNATTGQLSYTYELTDNTLADPSSVSFGLTSTDTDGDTKAGTLTISIIDDAPAAHADLMNLAPADFTAHSGNVITALNEVSASGADVLGADNAKVVGVAAGDLHADQSANVGTQINGSYGKLTLNDDGSYTYTRNAGSAGGVDDVFTYTLKDGDGDTSTTTLTIHIGDSPVTVTTPIVGDASDTVYEKGLPARNGEPAGSGEIADGNGTNNSDPSEKTSGVITINAPDGVQSVQFTGHTALNATDLASLSTTNVSYTDATGTLTLTGFDALTGKLSYTYELLDNTLTDPSSVSFGLTVTDMDGDSQAATLAITIIDDTPSNFDPQDQSMMDIAGGVITGTLNITNHTGADGYGSIVFSGGSDGSKAMLADGTTPMTWEGHNVLLKGYGTDTLTGYVDLNANNQIDSGESVFTVKLNGAADNYSFTLIKDIDDGEHFDFTDLGSVKGGNTAWFGVGVNAGTADSKDLLYTPLNLSTQDINTSSNDIGSKDQYVDPGEGVRMDFVQGLTGTQTTENKFDFAHHYQVQDFQVSVAQVGGGKSTSVRLTASDVTTDANDGSTTEAAFLAQTLVAITAGELQVLRGGVDIVGNGITVDYTDGGKNDGGVIINGLKGGDVIQLHESTGFDRLEIDATATSNQFSLSGSKVLETVSGHDLDTKFQTTLADGDGDTSSGQYIGINLQTDDGQNHTFTGGVGNDTIHGGSGNDTLSGGSGGSDLIFGDGGNDSMLYDSADKYDGGTGFDRVVVQTGDNSITYDGSKFLNIEMFDLGDTNDRSGHENTLALDAKDVIGANAGSVAGNQISLFVIGDNTGTTAADRDNVHLTGFSGIVATGTAVDPVTGLSHTFDVYQNTANATIKVAVEHGLDIT